MIKYFGLVAAIFLGPCPGVFSQTNDTLLNIVSAELQREVSEFKNASTPPYFISYRINHAQSAVLRSSFGSLTGNNFSNTRTLFTDVKVGSYDFDDSHPTEELEGLSRSFRESRAVSGALPLDNKPEAIKLELWDQTQKAYRDALESFKEKKNATRLSSDVVSDFSKEEPTVYEDGPLPDFTTFFDRAAWSEKIKKYSVPFLRNAEIIQAEALVRAGVERTYLITSEGTRIAQNRTFVYLSVYASIRSEDGDNIPLYRSYFAFQPDGLPKDDVILKDAEEMVVKLSQLRNAPSAEPYTGPAILYSSAAAVFFHEIFGHRVEGHRLKNKNDGQTFKEKIGEQVLPKSLSVVFDPTQSRLRNQDLNGYYKYDDEGVKARRVAIVEKGTLKTFLMSRTPIEHFTNSNGHGRGEPRSNTVSRQSNLIIENDNPVTMDALRKMLIEECKKQKKEYGYLFKDVVGGFTITQRMMPNAFNIFPIEVYRIYVDGRADELVRGVDLIGTPLVMFSEIQAADDHQDIFTGFCGAESGDVPVTATSPSLFVRQIETQKKRAAQLEKTLLQRPSN